MLKTISYVSTAHPTLTDSDINELLETVKERNNAYNITGILMYSSGNFFQVIEGQRDILLEVYEKIKLDQRHFNLIKIFDREIADTSFSEYHSSFTVVTEKNNNQEFQLFLKEQKSHNPDIFKNISYLAHKFMKLS